MKQAVATIFAVLAVVIGGSCGYSTKSLLPEYCSHALSGTDRFAGALRAVHAVVRCGGTAIVDVMLLPQDPNALVPTAVPSTPPITAVITLS